MSVAIFDDAVWQMSLGERAAVEGVLTQLSPALAIEIGSAEGACLRRIAAHAAETHSFDLSEPSLPMPANVTLHTGDSHELLPLFLTELTSRERNVDFVLVDGDHSSEGVRQDLEDLLNSPSVANTVILIHDIANERVRRGAEAVRFAAWPKVTHVELDWIPGRLFAEPELRNELWYGLGLVLVDSAQPAYLSGCVYEQRYHPAAALLADIRELVIARECAPADARWNEPAALMSERTAALSHALAHAHARIAELQTLSGRMHEALAQAEQNRDQAEQQRDQAEQQRRHAEQLRERADRTLQDVFGSASWKVTKPLRGAKRTVRRNG